MNISLQADLLQKKLSLLSHAVSPKPQLPILSGLLLEAKDNKIKLSSTDLEIGIETDVLGEVKEEGIVVIPARTFIDLLSQMGKETVHISTEGQTLTVQTSLSKSTFHLLPQEEYPTLYEDMGTLFSSLEKKQFVSSLEKLLFSASTDTGKPAYSGVLLRGEEEEGKKGFLLVTTDGFRLSLNHMATTQSTNTSLIVPARLLKEILLMKEEEGNLDIFVSSLQNQLILRIGETKVIGRLVGAEYPPFEKIIPSDYSSQASLPRDTFLKAVKICSIFARDSANVIKLSLLKDKVVVSSHGTTTGENTVDIPTSLKGEENEIAFNAKYLLDFLSAVSEEEITVEMVGPLNPGVFKLKDNPSYLHIIMPIRLQE